VAIGAFVQTALPEDPFPAGKDHNRCGRADECKHSKIRQDFATSSKALAAAKQAVEQISAAGA